MEIQAHCSCAFPILGSSTSPGLQVQPQLFAQCQIALAIQQLRLLAADEVSFPSGMGARTISWKEATSPVLSLGLVIHCWQTLQPKCLSPQGGSPGHHSQHEGPLRKVRTRVSQIRHGPIKVNVQKVTSWRSPGFCRLFEQGGMSQKEAAENIMVDPVWWILCLCGSCRRPPSSTPGQVAEGQQGLLAPPELSGCPSCPSLCFPPALSLDARLDAFNKSCCGGTQKSPQELTVKRSFSTQSGDTLCRWVRCS